MSSPIIFDFGALDFSDAELLARSELGVDIDVRDDLPPSFALARGLDNLANALIRRLQTPEGMLGAIDEGAADYGYDLRGKVLAKGTPQDLSAIVARGQAEILKDERVRDTGVKVDLIAETE